MQNEEDADLEKDAEDESADTESSGTDDVSLHPGPNADTASDIGPYISPEVRSLYDVYSYRHAAAILAKAFPSELAEIERALLEFRITKRDIGIPGGNESDIPKKYSRVLRPAGWFEARIQGDLLVRMQEYDEKYLPNGNAVKTRRSESTPRIIENFIDGHKIDYVKGRVAFDLEWNSKDQTFDRDLYAMRAFHECGLISLGVMVTRREKLNPVFDIVQQLTKTGEPDFLTTGKHAGEPKMVRGKYGASTTWMGKLLYRLNAGRHGGCPILVLGITPRLIEDLR
jgi:hypothetical protein